MRFGLDSLGGRFVWVSVTIIILLIAITIYSNVLVGKSVKIGLTAVEHNSSVGIKIGALQNSLKNIESNLFQHSSFLNSEIETQTNLEISHFIKTLNSLSEESYGDEVFSVGTELSDIRNEFAYLQKAIIEYFTLMKRVETRFPGMPYLLEYLEPNNNKFSQAVSLALEEAEITDAQLKRLDRKQYEVLRLFQEVRYVWAQQVSWLRLAVANRMGAFGDPERSMKLNLINRNAFSKSVRRILNELDNLARKDALGLQQLESLELMHEAAEDYEKNFDAAIAIYLSPNWRADFPLMKEKIIPAFDTLNNKLILLEDLLNTELSESISLSHSISELLSNYIWIFSGGMLLIMGLGYYVFQTSIRRPVREIANAMQAEERGEHYNYQPKTEEQLREVKLLHQAFFDMQEQVHNRQQRLETILNNAAEGIITFDPDGIIESFNSAAEVLFRCDRDEMIGKSITTIIPEISPDEIYSFVQLMLKKTYEDAYRDLEMIAVRKDGTDFPVSIKVSDMNLGNNTYYIAMVDDISERKAILENLKKLAEHDSLTGLYNRQFFMEELERSIAIAKRDNEFRSACMYIDLDNFKYINDTLGHMAGDRLLVEIAELISLRTRKSDLLARLGGDEFALFFHNVSEDQLLSIAEEYRQSISNYKFIQEGMIYTAACSIGIAPLRPDINDKEELLARADIACHVAKRQGRNCVHMYELVDKERIDDIHVDMGWSQRIKDAIEHDKFVFATQEVKETSSNNIHAYEVLLRMREDDGHLIMPSGFLSSAERFGLISQVDEWVIKHACQLLKQQQQVDHDARFSINLSAKSIGREEVLEVIKNAIKQNELKPADLIFEVTEDVAISDFPNAIAFLNRLRNLGCKTALDDFGAGYSSFSYLKEFPVDYVKIDGSFILGIENDKLNKSLVKAMNDVCHTLDKKTIAEFVENEAALKTLSDIGVDYVQGFVINRPVLHEQAGVGVETRRKIQGQ